MGFSASGDPKDRPHGRNRPSGVGANLGFALFFLVASPLIAGEWSGYAAFDIRIFADDAQFVGQGDEDLSLAFEPEYYHEWNEGKDSFTFTPFLRYDSRDSERTHFDVRELYWQRAARSWELRVGISKVFWGVTESQHLVDVINQTDLVENFDGEDKLGQPMVRLAWFRPWGTLEFFVLPGFRERTFPGRDGRLRPPFAVDTDAARYESSAEEGHVDLALRWSHVLGPFDIGVSHFRGTGRDPLLVFESSALAEPRLLPYYQQIDQTGLDLQATVGPVLWKLEAIRRSSASDMADSEEYLAVTGGFEYTVGSPFGTGWDLGLIAEYLWDEREEAAPTPFEDDLFVGARLALNDAQSTAILAGAVLDLDSDAAFLLVEASRRLFQSWKLEVELRSFVGIPETDPTASIQTDDFLLVSLARHF